MSDIPRGAYAIGARKYWDAGWVNILPVHDGSGRPGKSHVPRGYTGIEGRGVSWPDLMSWAEGAEGRQNLGVRLQAMVGIDVDAHDGERGAETLAKAEAELGPLPPTFSSTSRGPGPSRILFYRVPIQREPALRRREKALVDTYGPNIEILHRSHRFAVVWPSVHPDTGETYQWYGPDGQVCMVPRRQDIPELPETWLDFLAPEQRPEPEPITAPAPLPAGESQLFAPSVHSDLRTQREAERILAETLREFMAPDADGRATRLLPRLALIAGHGIPGGFWTETQAREGIEQAAINCGYVAKHGLADLRNQVDRGLRDGALTPWVIQADPEARTFDAAPTGRLRRALMKRSELHALPEPVPLIDGVLYRSSVVVLSGKFGTYKSFIAVSWAASIASGRPWFGHAVPERLPVIYAAAEGAYGIQRRLDAWEKRHGLIIPDDFYLLSVSARINRGGDMAELEELIRETGAKVVIFDTMHASTPGVDENDSGEMGAALDVLRGFQERHGICSILPHHTGHAGERARGTSSIEDDADTTFVVRLNGEDRGPDNPRTMVHRKAKDGPLLPDLELRLTMIEGTGSGVIDTPNTFEANQLTAGDVLEIGQQVHVPDPERDDWTWQLIPHNKSEPARRVLVVLRKLGGEQAGMTQSEVCSVVRSRWYGGNPLKKGRKGHMSPEVWRDAWTTARELQGRDGEPVLTSPGGERWIVNPAAMPG